MTIGIYKLTFKGLDSVYVGQSIHIEKRFSDHKYSLRSGKAAKKLQDAFNIYGLPVLNIIEECSIDELNTKEEYYINLFDSVGSGLNTKYLSGYRSTICGENSYSCNYTNEQISNALLLLIQYPKFSRGDVSEITGVALNTLKDIASLNSHFWLVKEYPEEYKKLVELKGNRCLGENNPISKYTNNDVIEAMLLITSNPTITLPRISELLNIPYSTIKSIANGVNHKWLKVDFPEEYALLMSLKGARSRSAGKTAQDKGVRYPPIVSPEGVKYIVTNIAQFSREQHLNSGHLGAVLRGKEKQHKGWRLESVGVQSVA